MSLFSVNRVHSGSDDAVVLAMDGRGISVLQDNKDHTRNIICSMYWTVLQPPPSQQNPQCMHAGRSWWWGRPVESVSSILWCGQRMCALN